MRCAAACLGIAWTTTADFACDRFDDRPGFGAGDGGGGREAGQVRPGMYPAATSAATLGFAASEMVLGVAEGVERAGVRRRGRKNAFARMTAASWRVMTACGLEPPARVRSDDVFLVGVLDLLAVLVGRLYVGEGPHGHLPVVVVAG